MPTSSHCALLSQARQVRPTAGSSIVLVMEFPEPSDRFDNAAEGLRLIEAAGLTVDSFEPITSPEETALILGTWERLVPPQPVEQPSRQPVPPLERLPEPEVVPEQPPEHGRLRGPRTGFSAFTRSSRRRRLPPS
jgi:hypothetical protein